MCGAAPLAVLASHVGSGEKLRASVPTVPLGGVDAVLAAAAGHTPIDHRETKARLQPTLVTDVST
ncbi:hypothetical protein ACHAPW_008391 [Verticillium nonalfalfae]